MYLDGNAFEQFAYIKNDKSKELQPLHTHNNNTQWNGFKNCLVAHFYRYLFPDI